MDDQHRENDVRDECYFDIDGLARYSSLSSSTLRRYMEDPINPLPHHHLHGGGKDRGRILISKRACDAWVASFPPLRSMIMPTTARRTRPAAWVRKLAAK